MLRVTLKNAKSSSQRGLKRYSFDYSTSKDTMRAYNGDKYLEQHYYYYYYYTENARLRICFTTLSNVICL